MELKRLISQIKRLPASPQVLPRLMNLLKDPNATSSEIVDAIKLDMSLAAQVQRLSNSSYYGFAEPSQDLSQAISRIGMQETYRLVAAVLCQELAARSSSKKTAIGNFWENSVACAAVMETLAKRLGIDEVEAYSVGLMHNIGLVLLQHSARAALLQVIEFMKANGVSLREAEIEVLGYDHTEAASILLQTWKFASGVVEPIAHQYSPMDAGDFMRSACMLHVSVAVVSEMGYELMGECDPTQPLPEALAEISLDGEGAIAEVAERASRRMEDLCKVFVQD